MNTKPGYEKYTFRELREVCASIDHERFPERYEEARRWLEKRRVEQQNLPPSRVFLTGKALTAPWGSQWIRGFLVAFATSLTVIQVRDSALNMSDIVLVCAGLVGVATSLSKTKAVRIGLLVFFGLQVFSIPGESGAIPVEPVWAIASTTTLGSFTPRFNLGAAVGCVLVLIGGVPVRERMNSVSEK